MTFTDITSLKKGDIISHKRSGERAKVFENLGETNTYGTFDPMSRAVLERLRPNGQPYKSNAYIKADYDQLVKDWELAD